MTRTEKIRISADPKDKGFRADWFRYEAYCNGERLHHCSTADEELGWALCYVTDEQGIIQGLTGGTLLTREYRGEITIKRLPDHAPDDAGETG